MDTYDGSAQCPLRRESGSSYSVYKVSRQAIDYVELSSLLISHTILRTRLFFSRVTV